MAREKDANWEVTKGISDTYTYEQAQLCVLMDIRDELKRLNKLLHCHNFVSIPQVLKGIRRNTTKKKRKKK